MRMLAFQSLYAMRTWHVMRVISHSSDYRWVLHLMI